MSALYDTIGLDYANLRRPDARIAARIEAALGDAKSVLNVGAGTGSYEPADRNVTALEPSAEMIAQRAPDASPAVQGTADALPFGDGSFDAAMAVLTVHHWPDPGAGLAEMRRVARDRIVILTFDPACRNAWLLDYLPALAELDEAQMPPMEAYAKHLGDVDVEPIPVPHDCSDGFLYAYWRRPQAYLDPRIRKGSSSFWKLDGLEDGLARLEADLTGGEWEARYGEVLSLTQYDAGYRLVTARL
ncbi:Methyltransferase domain-containing protein [Altererythrobacter xiamenensis]|uniref:Methyltransferase domain-containing protein n=1 Tax=Altererythrobacter xiamenensis TaxID=1316679 RepID=A0A1Y6FLM4_9SPHN|nr:class I SAM-dependent methyltransferase [Altererythrobacter xiamenensis]SMQ75838.1 Methyltransferase domain-containing protein [Altererythrobacter xiamenensis]